MSAIMSESNRQLHQDSVLRQTYINQLAQEHNWAEQERHWQTEQRHWRAQRWLLSGSFTVGVLTLVAKAVGLW